MKPSNKSRRNAGGLPPTGRPAHSMSNPEGRSSSSMGPVPQLDLRQAAEGARAAEGGQLVYGPLTSAMDTTRSQHFANCSDCMLPCKIFLGLSAPKETKPLPPVRSSSKQSCPPQRHTGPETGGSSRSGRSVSIGHSMGRTVASVQRQASHARPALMATRPPGASANVGGSTTAQPSQATYFNQTRQGMNYPLVRPAASLFRPDLGPVITPLYGGQVANPMVAAVQATNGVTASGASPPYPTAGPGLSSSHSTATARAGAASSAQLAASYAPYTAQRNVSGSTA